MNEIKRIEEELKSLNIESKNNKKKEDIYKLCKTVYETLSDEKTEFKIKEDIAHQLFDSIVYNKKEGTLTIIYKENT